MRRLALFLSVVVALLGAVALFDWWIDPFGDIYKPGALTAALDEHPHCLVSQELVGARYFPFKLDVFHRRPTTRFVVGSSRVLKIQAHPGESTFANLGFPGTSPETILALFRALPAKPVQTVYVGVEAFWFNPHYVVPVYKPTTSQLAQYLLGRATFQFAVKFVRQGHYILYDRWKRQPVGSSCVIGRLSPGIAWNVDGSRTYSWELDPQDPKPPRPPYTTDLATLRSGAYDQWTSFDEHRLDVLRQALALAKQRGWHVIGFAPPEPARYLHLLETDPRIAPRWSEYLRQMPRVFADEGYVWAGLWDGRTIGCRPSDYPDDYHTNAACSARLRARLDTVARK
jgi:hypothetical protein